jgi:hypothetical protein
MSANATQHSPKYYASIAETNRIIATVRRLKEQREQRERKQRKGRKS